MLENRECAAAYCSLVQGCSGSSQDTQHSHVVILARDVHGGVATRLLQHSTRTQSHTWVHTGEYPRTHRRTGTSPNTSTLCAERFTNIARHRCPQIPTNPTPTLPSFPPSIPYLVLWDTLCSCEAYGMKPERKDTKNPTNAQPGRKVHYSSTRHQLTRA